MPPPYQQQHWNVFSGFPHSPQGAVGAAPAAWVNGLGLSGVPQSKKLGRRQLTREQVRKICTLPQNHVLLGYVSAMAWGGQDRGLGSAANAKKAWANRVQLEQHLTTLRMGGLSRQAAYRLFVGPSRIPGLGPSFFTKLLYFFSLNSPGGQQPYIVDNVILRSVALLTGHPFGIKATAGGYQACCEEIDSIAVALGCTGEEAEERLFCRKKGPWRNYVGGEYRRQMSQAYPHIPEGDF